MASSKDILKQELLGAVSSEQSIATTPDAQQSLTTPTMAVVKSDGAINTPSTSETENSLGKTISFVSTVSLNSIIRTAGDFATYLMLAHIDDDHLAASNLIGTANTFITFTANSGLYSVGGVTGKLYKAGKNGDINGVLKNGTRLGLRFAAPAVAFALTNSYLFDLMGNKRVHTDILRSYFYTGFIGIPANILFMNLQQVAFGTRNGLPANVASLANASLKVGLAAVLVPSLKALGLGITNSVAAMVSLPVLTVYMLKSSRFQQYKFNFSWEGSSDAGFALLKKIGLPICLQVGSELLMFTISAGIMGSYMGADALASNQIAMQYLYFAVIPVFGTAQACTILISQSQTAAAARQIALNTFKVSAAISLTVLTAFSAIPKIFVSAYRNINDPANAGIVSITSKLFPENGVCLFFDGFRLICGSAIQGKFQDTSFAMRASLVSMFGIALPLGCALGLPAAAGLGPSGMYIARGAALALAGAALLWRWTKSINEEIQKEPDSQTKAISSASVEKATTQDSAPKGDSKDEKNANANGTIPQQESAGKVWLISFPGFRKANNAVKDPTPATPLLEEPSPISSLCVIL